MLVVGGKTVFNTLEELVSPQHTALLLIDLQHDYITPQDSHGNARKTNTACLQIVPTVKRLLDAARRHGILVVHIQMTHYPGHISDSPAWLRSHLIKAGRKDALSDEQFQTRCIEGTWGWQIVEELTPLPDEIVVRKHRSSAYTGTDLDLLLRSNGIKSVAITGLVTQGCVMATSLDAQLLDYYPVLVEDGIASPSAELHAAALRVLAYKMDTAVSGDVLKIWASEDSSGPERQR